MDHLKILISPISPLRPWPNLAPIPLPPAQHWPGDSSSLKFFAYAPINFSETAGISASQIVINTTTQQIKDFQPAPLFKDQIDFVVAEAKGKEPSKGDPIGVSLNFNHILSQIVIQAKEEMADYDFYISGVKIVKVNGKGTYDFSGEWTLDEDAEKVLYEAIYDDEQFKLTNEVRNLIPDPAESSTILMPNAILLPQQLTAWDVIGDAKNTKKGTYLAVKLKITYQDQDEKGLPVTKVYFPFADHPKAEWAAIPVGTNWEPGKKYVYTLNFLNGAGYVDPEDPDIPGIPIFGGPITFSVNVEDWVDAGLKDVDLDTPKGSGTETGGSGETGGDSETGGEGA